MSGIRVQGATSGNVAEVTDANELITIGPNTKDGNGNVSLTGGYVNVVGEVDDGAISGAPFQRQLYIDPNYRAVVGLDTPIFNENFTGSALNSAKFTSVVSGQTTAVSTGFLVLNSGSSTTNSQVSRVQTYRGFTTIGSSPTSFEMECLYVSAGASPQQNTVVEFGFGFCSGVTAPTDGMFFRYDTDGQLYGVLTFNGTETTSVFTETPSVNETHRYILLMSSDYVEFWVDQLLYTRIAVPSTGPYGSLTATSPMFFRHYNSGTPSAASQFKVGNVLAYWGGLNQSKPWSQIAAGQGSHSTQGDTGMTMGTTAQLSNSSTPTQGTPTNTTAALGTGLGGIFIGYGTSLSVGTDYIFQSYQVPAMASGTAQKTLYITGMWIDTANMGAAVNTNLISVNWYLAYGHTAVSLATAESATTKAPRRTWIGSQSIPASSAIGALYTPSLFRQFTTPIVVNPGEFVQTVARFNLVTTAANTEIRLMVGFDGYWE